MRVLLYIGILWRQRMMEKEELLARVEKPELENPGK